MSSNTDQNSHRSHDDHSSSDNDINNSGPSTSSQAGTSSSGTSANGGGGVDSSNFDCNICLDTAKDAVVSICGHLFCWPCLHQWFETKPLRKSCPVCKNPISAEQVIPLYGRGSDKKDPREKKIPPRPAGQRSEQPPEFPQTFGGFGFGDGFHMSFGIGAFPFGFFASTFNIGDFRAGGPPGGAAGVTSQNPVVAGSDFAQDQFISKLFLWVAIVFIVWLLFA